MILTQTIEYQNTLLDTTYPIMEHFYSLQGEGFWTGTPAYFIRLGGCDVGCFWCDVKESWTFNNHSLLSIKELLNEIKQTQAERIIITGGEPLLHNLNPLCEALQLEDYKLHLETSGTQELTGKFDWICFSPKKFKKPLESFYSIANELKIIVKNQHDLEWAESQVSLCNSKTLLFLQPEWDTPASAGWITDFIKTHPHWRISLQTHKYLNIR